MSANEVLVRDLAAGHFLQQQRSLVLVGGTGTGKTHLAIAIARACIRDGKRGRFYTVVDLVNRLEAETKAGRQGRTPVGGPFCMPIDSEMSQLATAIPAAVEQQGAATRAISASVHMLAGATPRATTAMHQVSEVSEAAGRMSREVLATAGEVALFSGPLRQEVDQSLAAMRADESKRRQDERLPGTRIMASPQVQGHPAWDTKVLNVSRGGIAVSCDLELAAAEAVEVSLPGMDTAAKACVARSRVGRLAVALRQDPAKLAVIERMLAMHWASPILTPAV